MKKTKDYSYPDCSCLDSAYERRAIDQGLVKNPVFPENIKYLNNLGYKLTREWFLDFYKDKEIGA